MEAIVPKQPEVTECSFESDWYSSVGFASCVVMLETIFVGQGHLGAHSTIFFFFFDLKTKQKMHGINLQSDLSSQLCSIVCVYLLWCNWNWFVGRSEG